MEEKIPLYNSKRKGILVIGGGGIKGLSALGAITKLQELNIISSPEILCGTSCGAMIAVLMLIGYSATDIRDLLLELDFTALFKLDLDDIFETPHIGLSSNEKFAKVLRKMMSLKGISPNITFGELYKLIPRQLIVTGTCLNDMCLHYFSAKESPTMSVVLAVQISMAVPVLFKPIHFDGKLWLDGGCLNNFPVEPFQSYLHDVIGVNLDGIDGKKKYECKTFEDPQSYLGQILACMIKGAGFAKMKQYEHIAINICCDEGTSFDWNITRESKVELFEHGYKIAGEAMHIK
jgi:NTE family protein